MQPRTQKRIVIAVMALLPLVPVLRIWLLLRSGEDVKWLEELWAPFAVLVIGMVTCAEVLLKEKGGRRTADGRKRGR